MTEKLWRLTNCNLFEKLSPEELKALELRCKSRTFPRKSPIYLPAENADGVFLLTSGRAKICYLTEDGKQSILAFIDPGELFGELALFDGGARDEYAEAVENSTVVMIPREEVERLMQENPSVSLGITKMIGLRRRRIERRLKNLLFLSNRERLVHLLLELLEQYGELTQGGVQLSIRLSHQELANIIGSTRETVTVVLGELQSEGQVIIGRRRITVVDPAKLAQSVHRLPPTLPHDTASQTAS